MTRQALIPGGGFLNESGVFRALVPGQGFANETAVRTPNIDSFTSPPLPSLLPQGGIFSPIHAVSISATPIVITGFSGDPPKPLQIPQSAIFSPIFAATSITVLSWFPRIADAPPAAQADKPNYFAPRWLLNLPISWFPILRDAAPVTLPDKPNFFAPGKFFTGLGAAVSAISEFAISACAISGSPPPPIVVPFINWLATFPSLVQPPITAALQTIFSPILALNIRLQWLPRLPDKASVVPPLPQGTVAKNAPQEFLPINQGNWAPAYPPVPIGRQEQPALKDLRQSPAELKEIRVNPPSLKLIRKKPPTLT